MAYSHVSDFQAIFYNYVLKHIQQCTNVEARRVLGIEKREDSLCELNAFIALYMHEERIVSQTFLFTIFGIIGRIIF